MKLPALALILFLHTVYSANILGIFPTPSISHQVVFRALMKDLAARGHTLTVITPDPFETDNPNITQIDWHSSYEIFRREFDFVAIKTSNTDLVDMMETLIPVMMAMYEEQLSHPEVIKLISNRNTTHFDLVIMELLGSYPMLGFAEIFDAPVIELVSLDTVNENHERMGNEVNPIVHPDLIFAFQGRRLTFKERWQVLKYVWKTHRLRPKIEQQTVDFMKKHFHIEEPDLDKMKSRIELLMTNTNPALGYIRPILPNTIQLGFMHIEPPKPLQEGPLKDFLDKSEHGVIYMSFGSNVQSKNLSPEVKKIFLDAFKSLKYDVLWKFEDDNLPGQPKNLMIHKWLPQADLLAHPKIKLFITQGGQQSMEEAIDRGIPTIVIPFLADQYANAFKMEQKKFGKHLDFHQLNTELLKSTIHEMLKPKYKENVKKLRNLIYDQPMSSRERAVWWTEYVIRHKGAEHFKYIGNEVPMYEKYFLDFAAIAVLGLGIFIKISLFIYAKVFSRAAIKNKTE